MSVPDLNTVALTLWPLTHAVNSLPASVALATVLTVLVVIVYWEVLFSIVTANASSANIKSKLLMF
jgi:hypothetical protein